MTTVRKAVEKEDWQGLWHQAEKWGKGVAYAVAGFLLSEVSAYSLTLSPGIALTAAAPGGGALPAAAGTALGILLMGEGARRVQGLAVLCGTAAVKWVLRRWSRNRDAPYPMAAALFCLQGISALALMAGTGFSWNGAAIFGSETLLAALAVPVFYNALTALRRGVGEYLPSRPLLACLGFTGGALLLSVAPWNVWGTHPARMLAGFAVLGAAFLGEQTLGGIVGIAVGLALNAGGAPGTLALFWPAAGICCAMARQNRWISAGAICLLGAAFGLLDGTGEGAALLVETGLAAAVFLLIPEKPLARLRVRLIAPELTHWQGGYSTVPAQLRAAAAALQRVSAGVTRVSDGMAALTPTARELILLRARERVCGECPLMGQCGCPERGDLDSALRRLQQTGILTRRDFRPGFAEECPCAERLSEALISLWEDAGSDTLTAARRDRCREMACSLFTTVSRFLGEVSLHVADGERVLTENERIAADTLARLGAQVVHLRCTEPVDGAVTLQITAVLPRRLSPGKTARLLGEALGMTLTVDGVTETERGTCLLLRRKPLFSLRLGTASSAADNGKFCGDYCDYFSTGAEAYALLSDGMGTGARAAVDAALTVDTFSRLIKAGTDPDTALDITNTALNVRSGEEAIATLDAARVNLYTGEVTFLKAGAAVGFCTVGGRVRQVEICSLPLGILSPVSFKERRVVLKQNDTLLLMSDGVTEQGSKWIEDALRENPCPENMGELARQILKSAGERHRGRRDDMTVVAASLVSCEENQTEGRFAKEKAARARPVSLHALRRRVETSRSAGE